MEHIKKLIYSIKEIIIIYILQYIIIFILSLIYTLLGHEDLTSFMSNYLSIIMMIFYILSIIYIVKKYHYPNIKINSKMYYPYAYLGLSLSCFLNMIIFLITKKQGLELTLSLLISIISTGIIGPILEELLFRYILLNKLKEFNSDKLAIIISTIIFGIVHGGIISIIYAIILGLILNIIYHKKKSIIPCIIIHSSANIISIFLTNFNIWILILSFIGLILSAKLITKNKS